MSGYQQEDAGKNQDRGYHGLAVLYGLKGVLGLANVGLIAATTFTYAAPTIGRLTGQAVYEGAARAVGARAAAIIGTRILFMSAGMWITVGTFTIQAFIWWYEHKKLVWWCEACAFGTKRDKSWTAEKQVNVLTDALDAIGMKQ